MTNVEQKVVDVMRSCGIDTALTLPCDRMKNLFPLISENFNEIPLTREEDGIGIAAGLYMAGKRPVMVIQSTGLGNSINALSSLHKTFEIPLPILASWRGPYKEGIEAQLHLGKCLPGILDSAGIPYVVAETVEDLPKVKSAIEASFEKCTPYVILLSPRIWEGSTAKPFIPEISQEERKFNIACNTIIPKATQSRFDMIIGIVPYLKDKVVVANIGVPCKELYAALDQPTNFYMLGSLGLASSIGNGLAQGQKREVVVLDGDGSLLMNPNTLGTVAQEFPDNLTIIAFDNSAHGSTGNQKTFSSCMDLELLARVYGIKNTSKVSMPEELLEALEKDGRGPRFIHAVILAVNADVPNIPMSAVDIKKRFISSLK
ncbi:sulfopyruvate decarboxylase [Methanocella sp. CWC-04]|uniref:sulfopyruvate decarboxylase n=1 Tax=Methanooceanicella nereidis TaxID=2052831 RepID=A0AAP2RAV4_9EURY|nr:sulfopyruvate decarboxylase subunit beta [Methanocella sp. CWC-04]MCD1293933.1 sulfopyruvate decarboxylase [Methanocella sp. CWC-04]